MCRWDVIIAELAYHVGVTNIAEKHWSVVPGFEPRTSRKPGECSTIELQWSMSFCYLILYEWESVFTTHIVCKWYPLQYHCYAQIPPRFFPPRQNNITGCSGHDTRRSDFVQQPLFLTCVYGTRGVDTGHSISARLFIINHDPLNSGNYIHKEITNVSVVGYI